MAARDRRTSTAALAWLRRTLTSPAMRIRTIIRPGTVMPGIITITEGIMMNPARITSTAAWRNSSPADWSI